VHKILKSAKHVKKSFLVLLLTCLATVAPAQAPPATPVRPVVDKYFDREIVDPYRWLENLKDPEVINWLQTQNDYTHSIIDKLPWRDRILDRIRELDRQSPPAVKSLSVDDRGRYYFIRSDADGISRGYARDSKTGSERIVLDPTTLKAGSITLTSISPSPDGRYVAFVARESDGPKLYIADAKTAQLVGPPVADILGFTGLDWDIDSRSIYIVKLPRPGSSSSEAFLNSASYRHVVGSESAADQPIIGHGKNAGLELKETSFPFVFPLPDPKYLAVWIEDGSRTGHALYVAERSRVIAGNGNWKKIVDFDDGATHAVFHGDRAFLTLPRKTDGKPQIMSIDITSGDISSPTPVPIPGNDVISDVEAASDALHVTVKDRTASDFYRVPYRGRPKPIQTPVNGTTDALLVTPTRPGGLFRISSWTEPAAVYEFSTASGWTRAKIQPPSTLGKDLDLISEDVKVKSHDGVEIPFTIVHKRDLKRDSSNPTLLIGYGSYGFTIDPSFDNVFVPWFEAGGILAYAHVRGGGELGETWHLAGSKDKKPNTWRDFIACAQYLVDQKYTSPAKLVGEGTSAGGVLIGRAITERPDLFRAALISVGTTDMLRAEYQMNGPANVVEFGTVKDKTSFGQLLEMSAYHHVVSGKHYPALLLTTGMRDPNVDVWQPAKMTAILQSVADTDRPVLLRIDPEAGHDQYGSTRAQMQTWRADQLAFLMWQLGVKK
jgi:prolyl oligopeptidase